MALIKFTNPSTENTLHIDCDLGDRFNRYSAKWVFAASETKSIDEANIDPSTDQPLADALRSGQLTIVESDLDNLTGLHVKDFLASGLDVGYYTGAASLTSGRLVAYDTTAGTINYVATLGDAILGIANQDGTLNVETRVKTSGSFTGSAGGAITKGSYLISDTTGRLVVSTVNGKHSVGIAPSDQTTGGSVVFVYNPYVIGKVTIGRLNESNV
jgi:hypothetical protein